MPIPTSLPYTTGARRMDLNPTKSYLTPTRRPAAEHTGCKLRPLSRLEHPIKTPCPWRMRQPEPGVAATTERTLWLPTPKT
jgi:hypothetical protein